jgi:hypothetical protein
MKKKAKPTEVWALRWVATGKIVRPAALDYDGENCFVAFHNDLDARHAATFLQDTYGVACVPIRLA